MNKCKFDRAWQSVCGQDCEGDFCEKHLKEKCAKCGKQAIGNCSEDAGSFICGANICEDKCHKHNY